MGHRTIGHGIRPHRPTYPPLRCARETRSESVRFWSGVTRSMKSGARVSQARMDAIFLPHARSRGSNWLLPIQRSASCRWLQSISSTPFRAPSVCDIGDRITYFYGTGIRQISLNVLAERSFIFPVSSFETVPSKPKQSKANKGCEYEYKDPCGGLLSADTLGTTACAETARYVCQDHGLQSWSGNSQ